MFWGLTFVQLCILIVIIAAVIALTMLALRQFGVQLPGWVVQVFWIVIVAIVIILAIKLVAGLF